MAIPFDLNVTDILPSAGAIVGSENGWMLYVFGALVFGIILGGTIRGLARLVLGLVLVAGFIVVVLMAMQRNDLLTAIASVVFGLIMLLFSFLVKIGKSHTYVKR
jgi:predicted branched-subunit amino acid permease